MDQKGEMDAGGQLDPEIAEFSADQDRTLQSRSLRAAGTGSRLIIAKGLPHTFLRALHMCGAASRAFEDFGREHAALLRN